MHIYATTIEEERPHTRDNQLLVRAEVDVRVALAVFEDAIDWAQSPEEIGDLRRRLCDLWRRVDARVLQAADKHEAICRAMDRE